METDRERESKRLETKSVAYEYAIFNQMSEDLEQVRPRLTTTAYQAAKDMISLHRSMVEIQGVTGSTEIERRINQLPKSGAEEGFGAVSIKRRIELFTSIYSQAKEQDKLQGFFSCFVQSACLSGRTNRLYKFANTLSLPEVDLSYDPSAALEVPGYVISEILDDEIDTLEDLRSHLSQQANFNKFVEDLRAAAAAGSQRGQDQAFIEYLRARGIYQPSGDGEINWETLARDFIRSPALAAALSAAREQVVEEEV
ncbi:MAG: hypothetical protein HYZ47_03890 [Simkania negevensis]|nr:hypothetical protein [Simkania negevensis]